MKAQEITGKIVLADGREVEFNIFSDGGYQQWGAAYETLCDTSPIIQCLSEALCDEGLIVSDLDDTCGLCDGPLASDGVCVDDECGAEDE